jgi:hypothetical protein
MTHYVSKVFWLLAAPTSAALADLWRFMRVRKKFWLLPIVIMMMVFGGLLLLTTSAVAPFVYTLFQGHPMRVHGISAF